MGEGFDFALLGFRDFWPDEVVVDDIFAVAIIAFEAAGNGAHPRHVHAAGEDGEVVEGGVRDCICRICDNRIFCEVSYRHVVAPLR